MFTECTEQKGFHIWSDIALVEIIDPKTEEPLEAGEKGELTITIPQKEALPMIRFVSEIFLSWMTLRAPVAEPTHASSGSREELMICSSSGASMSSHPRLNMP